MSSKIWPALLLRSPVQKIKCLCGQVSAVKCSLSKQTWSWLDGAAADGGKKLRLVASDGEDSASPPLCLDDGSAHGTGPPPSSGQVWARRLHNNASAAAEKVAVLLFNPGEAAANVTASWAQIGLPSRSKGLVRDLWQHKDVGVMEGQYSATVAPHGGVFVTVTETV